MTAKHVLMRPRNLFSRARVPTCLLLSHWFSDYCYTLSPDCLLSDPKLSFKFSILPPLYILWNWIWRHRLSASSTSTSFVLLYWKSCLN